MPLILLLFDLEISKYAHSIANFTEMTKMGLNYGNTFSIKKKFVKTYSIEILWNDVKIICHWGEREGNEGGVGVVYKSILFQHNMV